MPSGRVEPISSYLSLIVKKSFGRLVIPSHFSNCNMNQIKPISNKKNKNSTGILWGRRKESGHCRLGTNSVNYTQSDAGREPRVRFCSTIWWLCDRGCTCLLKLSGQNAIDYVFWTTETYFPAFIDARVASIEVSIGWGEKKGGAEEGGTPMSLLVRRKIVVI